MKFGVLKTILCTLFLSFLTGCYAISLDENFNHLSSSDTSLLVVKSQYLNRESKIWLAEVDWSDRKFISASEKYSILYKFPEDHGDLHIRALKVPPGTYALTAMIGTELGYARRTIKQYCNARDALVFEVKEGEVNVLDYDQKYTGSLETLTVFKRKAKNYKGIQAEILEARKIATISYQSERNWPCNATSRDFKTLFEF